MKKFGITLLIAVLALGATGCGKKDEKSIKACLKKISKLKVEAAPANEKEVKWGIMGLRFTPGENSMLMAVAAEAKSQKSVDTFKKEIKTSAKSMGSGSAFKYGTDDKYVWAVAGTKGKDFDKAMDCVK